MEEPVFVKCEPAWLSDVKEEPCNFKMISCEAFQALLYKPAFRLSPDTRLIRVGCVRPYPLTLRCMQELSAVPFSVSELNIKEDPWAVVADRCSEGVNIKLVEELCPDKDEIGEVHNEVCESSGGSSHKVENAVVFNGTAVNSCDIYKTCDEKSSMIPTLSTQTGERGKWTFECPICGKSFRKAKFRRNHLKIHTETSHCCSFCGKTFKAAHRLDKHRKTHCSICGVSITCSSKMKNHISQHTVNTVSSGSLCTQKLNSESSLKHQHVHSDIRTFDCSICGTAFRTQRLLKCHAISHSSEKSYDCDTCGKAFKHYSGLWYHKILHTGLKPHKCSTCGMEFAHVSSIQNMNRFIVLDCRFLVLLVGRPLRVRYA